MSMQLLAAITVACSSDPPASDASHSLPASVAGSASAPTAGASSPPTAARSQAAGAMMPGASECQKDTVEANEVVFIGESFIAATNAIPRMTSELAREAGTIGAGESYRSFAVSGTQLTTGDIPNQYTRAKAESPVKVVLMDGGGNDLLIGSRCRDGFDAGCKEVVDVVSELFSTFKADGVKDVVYFFYPDPMGIGAQIKAAMGILRGMPFDLTLG